MDDRVVVRRGLATFFQTLDDLNLVGEAGVTTEEMVHLGYTLPRLDVQPGSTSLAAAPAIVRSGQLSKAAQ